MSNTDVFNGRGETPPDTPLRDPYLHNIVEEYIDGIAEHAGASLDSAPRWSYVDVRRAELGVAITDFPEFVQAFKDGFQSDAGDLQTLAMDGYMAGHPVLIDDLQGFERFYEALQSEMENEHNPVIAIYGAGDVFVVVNEAVVGEPPQYGPDHPLWQENLATVLPEFSRKDSGVIRQEVRSLEAAVAYEAAEVVPDSEVCHLAQGGSLWPEEYDEAVALVEKSKALLSKIMKIEFLEGDLPDLTRDPFGAELMAHYNAHYGSFPETLDDFKRYVGEFRIEQAVREFFLREDTEGYEKSTDPTYFVLGMDDLTREQQHYFMSRYLEVNQEALSYLAYHRNQGDDIHPLLDENALAVMGVDAGLMVDKERRGGDVAFDEKRYEQAVTVFKPLENLAMLRDHFEDMFPGPDYERPTLQNAEEPQAQAGAPVVGCEQLSAPKP